MKNIADLSRSYRLHVHDELSVAHVWNGSSIAFIDEKEVPVSRGSVVLIAPGIAHACNPVTRNDWQYTLVLLRPELKILSGRSHLVMPSTSRLRASFDTLRKEGHCSEENLFLALTEAINPSRDEPLRPLRGQVLRRVMAYLRDHLHDPLSLDDLADLAGLSKFHLLRSFRKAYGLTPHAYQLNLKVNEAKERLKRGEILADVALQCGFCDQSHFTRVFARCVGMSPSRYQKNHGNFVQDAQTNSFLG